MPRNVYATGGDVSAVGVQVLRRLWRPRRGESGASAVEYALLVAAVGVLLIGLAAALTGMLGGILTENCKQTAEQNGVGPAEIASNQAKC